MDKYPEVRIRHGSPMAGSFGIQTWMQYYVSMVMDAIAYKRLEWRPFAKYIATLPMLFFTKPYATLGPVSDLFVKDPVGRMPDSWDEILSTGIVYYYGYTDAEARAMMNVTSAQDAYNIARAMYTRTGKAWAGKYENGVCDLHGNPLSVDGHTVDFTAAVVAAYNVGAAGSEEALRYIENLPTKPNFNVNQKYHLVPRSKP
jgi:hypothetical protein